MKTIDSAQTLGQVIRGARIERGLSQQAVAELSGLSRKYIGDLELGKETVELGAALRVAATMDIVWNAPAETPQAVLDQAARTIAQEISNDDSQFALQLAMDCFLRLKSMKPFRLKKPPTTGSQHFDALLAAGAREVLDHHHSTPPRWGSKLADPWFPAEDRMELTDDFRALSIKRTPRRFAEFNIFLKDNSLDQLCA